MRNALYEKKSLVSVKVMRGLCAVALVICSLLVATKNGDANSRCQIGVKSGTVISDSSITSGLINTSTDWSTSSTSNASVIQSGDPCLDYLVDYNCTTASYVNKVTKFYSKRDGTYLYLGFEVQDQTQHVYASDATCSGTGTQHSLQVGEKIIIQIDGTHDLGTQLSANDYRIDVMHKWNTNGAGGIAFESGYPKFYERNPLVTNCTTTTTPPWTTFPPVILAGAHTIAGGYSVAMKIPLNQIGSPTNDIGIAIAITNDLGRCDGIADGMPSGACSDTTTWINTYDVTGASFPNTLPVTNQGNPLLVDVGDPAGCPWAVPNDWGTGYFNQPLADVTISRDPAPWNSDAIKAFACGIDDSNHAYAYYPDKPCKIEVKSKPNNNDTVSQVRNILYLWGSYGTSQWEWKVIKLKKEIIQPGETLWFTSDLWASAPKGAPEHPCVQVYILPDPLPTIPTTDPNYFNAGKLSVPDSILTSDELGKMKNAYGLGDQNWAQKNISRATGTTNCPFTGCEIALAPHSPNNYRILSEFSLMSVAYAGTLALSTGAEDKKYAQVILSGNEFERFSKDNVIVQVRAFGYSKPSAKKTPRFNFIEDLGGVIKIAPVALVQANNGNVPFQMTVGNLGKLERTIFLNVATYAPSGAGPVHVNIDTRPQTYAPGESRIVKSTWSKPCEPGIRGLCCRLNLASGTMLFFGVTAIGGGTAGFIVRNHRRKKNEKETEKA